MKIPLTICLVFLYIELFSQVNFELYEENKLYGHITQRQCSKEYVYYEFKDSLNHGCFCYYNVLDSSIVRIRGCFNSYKRDSTWYFYWPDGTIRLVENYKNGSLNGNFKSYDRNGNLQYYGKYINGQFDGECIIPDLEFERGIATAYFINGKPTGIWKIMYEGTLMTEIDYTNGEGNHKVTFYQKGKISEVRQYKNYIPQ